MQQPSVQQPQPQFTFEGGHLVMFHQEQTGLPITRDATVNDRDRTFDLLAQEKYLSSLYNIAMFESSHDQLHQILKQNLDTVHQLQRTLFNTAFKKGWYRLPVADAQSLFTTFNDVQKHRSEFPYPAQQGAQGQDAGSAQSDQQLQQKVQKALQQASQGKGQTH